MGKRRHSLINLYQEETKYPFIEKESIPRFRRAWKHLLSGSLRTSFYIHEVTQPSGKDYISSAVDNTLFDLNKAIKMLKKLPWREGRFEKQHWGSALHTISPYQGRITPAFAYWLVRIFSRPGDVVLDPFCGVGTIPLECDLQLRNGIANDLSDYAIAITKAKFDRRPMNDHLNFLRSTKYSDITANIENIPEWVKEFYNTKTLTEITYFVNAFKEIGNDYLFGCLLGLSHGNHLNHLSVRTDTITPMKPRKPDHPNYRDEDRLFYRAVIPRLATKAIRCQRSYYSSKTSAKIIQEDARNLNLPKESVDKIISSPPYYDTLDYIRANKLRLWFCGVSSEEQKKKRKELIQKRKTYIPEMKEVGKNLFKLLIPNGLLIFVLGDVWHGKKNLVTAKDVSEVYEDIGFETIIIVDDELPKNKMSAHSFLKLKRNKLDRILVMKKRYVYK